MLRSLTAPLMFCRRFQARPSMHCSSVTQTENASAVEALCSLSVDISKIRKLKGWVLCRSAVHVLEVATVLRTLGARDSMIAGVLERHPEAMLCTAEHVEAQKELWMGVCASRTELIGIIEKFPASFFTSPHHINHQRANIAFFQKLGFHRRVVAKLMASAPQNFSRPVEQNEETVGAFQATYLELGGNEVNMKVWLQKLLSQDPYVLMKPPDAVRSNVNFLHQLGFTSAELLQLLSKLKGFVTELHPEAMGLALSYAQETLACGDAQLRRLVLRCPALLYYSVPSLTDRFNCLLGVGVSLQQIMQTPAVLELTPQIVQYRSQRLRSYGHDIRTGSLEILNGTKKEFEMSCGRLLRRERPHFNPVAPLRTDD